MKISFEKLKATLANAEYPQIPTAGLKISSVIMPFYFTKEDHVGVLLTKRSDLLKNHAGQISFPGGKFDEADKTLVETALREWEEETGESRNSLEVLGSYHSVNTGTGYHITPFISIYKGNFEFKVNHHEVDYMIPIELEEFLFAPFYTIEWEKHLSGRINIYYFDLLQGLLWGATCHILFTFLHEMCGFERKPKLVKPNSNIPPFFLPPKNT